MLRTALLVLALATAAAGAIGIVGRLFVVPGIWLLWTGGILAVGIVYERVRYKPVEKSRPGPGWERTTERFVDEESGKILTVYIRPETGERMYVED